MQRPALSQLVIYSTHGAFDLRLADSVAGYLLGPDRTPDDRRRGAQYRLVARAGQGRWPEAVKSWREAAGRYAFDPWIVEAYFAGYPARDLAEPMFAWARVAMLEKRAPDFNRPLWDDIQQGFQALVHRATLEGDSAGVIESLDRIDHSAPSRDPSDPTRTGLRTALEARLALLAGDTLGATGLLRKSVSRIAELSPRTTP